MRTLAWILTLVSAAPILAGCFEAGPALDVGAGAGDDVPAVAPSNFSDFHRVGDLPAFRDALVARAPNLTEPFAVGTSVEGRDLIGLRVTAPGDASQRVRVLFDGGIHGNEVYGIESVLYVAAWLVENYGSNATATRILETADVRFILLVNPDGRVADTRTNTNGVDLNRNFDADHGNPDPRCRSQNVSPLIPYYFAGMEPFSEPESRAVADVMETFPPEIYLTYHTGRHALIRPWAACDPPFTMPAHDDAVFEAIEEWTRQNTEFQNTGTAEETANRAFPPGAASGSSMDWCYMVYHCVGLTMEVSVVYGEGNQDPVDVAEEAFPIALHMLEHAGAYAVWRAPTA